MTELNDKKLFDAIESGDTDTAKTLIEKGADVNARYDYSETPLIVSVLSNKEIVELLISKGADINAENEFGETALYKAITFGKKKIAELLIKEGADFNASSKKKWSLAIAAEKGEKDIAKMLVDKGADLNITSPYGESLLNIVMKNLDINFARFLLKNGVKLTNEVAIEGLAPVAFLSSYIDPNESLRNYYANFDAGIGRLSPKFYETVVNFILDEGIDPQSKFNGYSINEAVTRHINSSSNIIDHGETSTWLNNQLNDIIKDHQKKNSPPGDETPVSTKTFENIMDDVRKRMHWGNEESVISLLKDGAQKAKNLGVYNIWSWCDKPSGQKKYSICLNVSESNDIEFDPPEYVTQKERLWEKGFFDPEGLKLIKPKEKAEKGIYKENSRKDSDDPITDLSQLKIITCQNCGEVFKIGVNTNITSWEDVLKKISGSSGLMAGDIGQSPDLIAKFDYSSLTSEQIENIDQGNQANMIRIAQDPLREWQCNGCKTVQKYRFSYLPHAKEADRQKAKQRGAEFLQDESAAGFHATDTVKVKTADPYKDEYVRDKNKQPKKKAFMFAAGVSAIFIIFLGYNLIAYSSGNLAATQRAYKYGLIDQKTFVSKLLILDQKAFVWKSLIAEKAFGKIGYIEIEVVPALIAALKDSDSRARCAAAEALGDRESGVPAAKEAVPALIAAIKDSDRRVRRAARKALRKIGPAAKKAVPALIAALNDGDANVRRAAAYALGKTGPAAKEAVPALIAALKNNHYLDRNLVAEALEDIGPAAKEAVPALIAALKDSDWRVRKFAAKALGDIGPAAKEAVPALIAALKDSDWRVGKFAAKALGDIGPAAKEAVPALIAARRDSDWFLQEAAVKALIGIGPEAVPALTAELSELKNYDRLSQKAIVEALVEIGSEAVPALIAALKDRNSDVRFGAAEALGKIGSEAVPALIAALKDRESSVRFRAVHALVEIGPAGKEAVPALIVAIEDRNPNVRLIAVEALGKIGLEAVPALIAALKNRDKHVRYSAIEALEEIGPAAKEAVPALIVALKDRDSNVRYQAGKALRAIQK